MMDDLARWNRALHEGRVLKNDTYTRMITPVRKAKEPGYGYGSSATQVRSTPALEQLTGVYTAEGMEFHITLDGDTLSGQIRGQPQGVPLVATSPTRFTADVVGAELTFAPETGPAKTVTLRQGGQAIEFERMPAAN